MPTLVGARRRGYTADALNKFCEDIGVTRNDNTVVPISRLEECVRDDLNAKAVRAMAVIDPVKLTITNWTSTSYFIQVISFRFNHFVLCVGGTTMIKRPNIPEKDEAGFNEVPFTGTVWIQREDFKEEDVKNYYGLALKTANGQPKWVRLRYACVVRVTEVKKNANGDIVELLAEYDKDNKVAKTMGALHWVDAGSVRLWNLAEQMRVVTDRFLDLQAPLEVDLRLYDHLFTVEDPGSRGDKWLTFINPNSLTTVKAYADPTVKST